MIVRRSTPWYVSMQGRTKKMPATENGEKESRKTSQRAAGGSVAAPYMCVRAFNGWGGDLFEYLAPLKM